MKDYNHHILLKTTRMKKNATQFLLLALISLFWMGKAEAQFPTIYASVASGPWSTAANWETFTGNATNAPGAQGTGTVAGSAPSGTHVVYIRNGHTITMNASNRACMSLFVEAGGKLWANETTARRLQLGTGGTGFLYPQTGTCTNNGTIGGATDGIFFEPGTNCQNLTFSGTGSTIGQRLRMPGGYGSAAGGVVNVVFDQNITFTQAANYALSASYNPTATDNYSITINAGKTITVSDAAGYFNNNSGTATGGNYTYNINGTLDLSASTQTASNISAISPLGGTFNININGSLKTGAAFNSSPVAPGLANINVADGITVDGTLATVMNFGSNSFVLAGSAALKRSVPNDGSKISFPISKSSSSFTPVAISSTTGPAEIYTVGVKNSFTNTPPAKTILKEWSISEATAGGNEDTLRFSWITADEAGSGGFDNTSTVSIIRWNGSTWVYTPATVSGAGTTADPYVAKGIGFTSFGLFGVNSTASVPVTLVRMRASQKQSGVQVEFSNATEINVTHYIIEKAADGHSFAPVATLQPKLNNGSLSSYSYYDATPFKGSNFYRVRAVETNGSNNLSGIVSLSSQTDACQISIFPNPVTSKTVSIKLQQTEKALYTFTVSNSAGQVICRKQMACDGSNSNCLLDLPASTKPGTYTLDITTPQHRSLSTIVVQ
jgi:hypothetical protein